MALRTLGQLTPQIPTSRWLGCIPSFPNSRLIISSLTSHCLPYQEDYLSASPSPLSFKSQSTEHPFRKSPQLSCEGAESGTQSGQHPVFFFFTLLNVYIYCPKTSLARGLWLLCILFPHSRQQKLLRKEGREKGQTGGRERGRYDGEKKYIGLHC